MIVSLRNRKMCLLCLLKCKTPLSQYLCRRLSFACLFTFLKIISRKIEEKPYETKTRAKFKLNSISIVRLAFWFVNSQGNVIFRNMLTYFSNLIQFYIFFFKENWVQSWNYKEVETWNTGELMIKLLNK